MAWTHVMAWLSFVLAEGRAESFMVEPVCTTFSIMRRPALRDRHFPLGFQPWEEKTNMGNQLALRGLQCMHIGGRNYVPGIYEAPFSSKVRYLPSWRSLERRPGISQIRSDSCAFGSPHLKPFRFLGAHMEFKATDRRCSCKQEGRKHIQIQGQLTKKSATYVPGLAAALADDLASAVIRKRLAVLDDGPPADGLEDQLVNEVMKTSNWLLESKWVVKKSTHINLLEVEAVCKLASKLALRGGDTRAVVFVDSNVTKGATSKGRSSSLAISSYLRRLGATSISGGLYITTPFVPTRLNAADDPTREAEIRRPILSLGLNTWETDDIYRLSESSKLRRWASNWSCLVIKLCGPNCLRWRDRSYFRLPWEWRRTQHSTMDFDQTLGFPGEGPQLLLCFLLHSSAFILSMLGFFTLISRSSQWYPKSLKGLFIFFVLPCWNPRSHFLVEAMPITARNSADRQRAAERAGRLPLSEGRVVTTVTKNMRETLLGDFLRWTDEENIPWSLMMADAYHHLEEVNTVLVSFGRLLHQSGRPYQHFAETINAIVNQKLVLKRNLQAAWSLAFSWIHDEPSAHHVAMPFQVLMACLSTCMLWGWFNVGGVMALAWGAFLRAGEAINAQRKSLLLPSDVAGTINFCLVSIMEPKTRNTAARHQTAKLDIPDLLQFVEACFSNLEPHQRLWPYSGQTLRLRFRCLMRTLNLPTKKTREAKPLDLGSLRAGGATWGLMMTEDAELIRRRGRWISSKTMEIYIQELSASTFLMSLDPDVRNNILYLAKCFPLLLRQSLQFHRAGIPQTAWRFLYSQAERV